MKNSILFGLAVALIVLSVLQYRSCSREKSLTSVINMKNDSIRIWQDDASRWHGEALTAQVTKADLQQFFAMEVEQIRKDFDVKLKNVTAYMQATTDTRDTVLMKTDSTTKIIIQSPSGDTAKFQYTDQWSRFDAVLTPKQMQLSYLVRDSVSFVTAYKRAGLFAPQQLTLQGISYNPNTRISGIRNITITTPVKRFSAGPYVGYGWTGSSWAPSIGVSIQYSLLKF